MLAESFTNSPLGVLHLQQTGDYISAIRFIDAPGRIQLGQEPSALLSHCAVELTAYFEGSLRNFTIPLQQSGTNFQQRVWNKLETIPFGKTISYMQLAIRLGDPRCIRAAGTSNGKNNIAIVVPCHRVIGNNGSLTGYAGGLHRKRWLLAHEAKFEHGVQSLFN